MFVILSAIILHISTVVSIPIRQAKQLYIDDTLSPSLLLDPSTAATSAPSEVPPPYFPLGTLSAVAASKPAQLAVETLSSPARSFLSGRRVAKRLNSLPPCQRQCVRTLSDIVGDVLHTSSYIEKYHKTCAAYREAKVCVIKQQRLCNESGEMFDVIASGIHFMCVEQGKAFNASIECIEHNAFSVQALCEFHCHTRESLLNIVTESAFSQPFGNLLRSLRWTNPDVAFGDTHIPFEADLYQFPGEPGGNPLGTGNSEVMEMLDPDWTKTFEEFEYITGQACQQAECALMCVKGKYDMICGNYTGMLIAESIVRPMALGLQKFPIVFLAGGAVLPNSCKFLSSGTRMMRHRMDIGTHAELLHRFGATDEEEFFGHVDEDSSEQSDASGLSIGDSTDIEPLDEDYHGSGSNANDKYQNGLTAAPSSEGSGDVANRDGASGDAVLDEEASAEGSGDMDAAVESSGEFGDGSGEEHEKGKTVYRAVLHTSPAYYEFTANTTGTLRCRVLRRPRNI